MYSKLRTYTSRCLEGFGGLLTCFTPHLFKVTTVGRPTSYLATAWSSRLSDYAPLLRRRHDVHNTEPDGRPAPIRGQVLEHSGEHGGDKRATVAHGHRQRSWATVAFSHYRGKVLPHPKPWRRVNRRVFSGAPLQHRRGHSHSGQGYRRRGFRHSRLLQIRGHCGRVNLFLGHLRKTNARITRGKKNR